MSWTKRLPRFLCRHTSCPASRTKKPNALHTRRVLVEPLEDRRLLSVAGAAAAAEYDFGDLPDNYGTTLAADGARHQAAGPTLGATRDSELDGVPTPSASGDDTNAIADEDGVNFGTIQVGQLDASVIANVQNAPSGAKLDAWIDFNGDGSFGGAGERMAAGVEVAEGDNVVEFDVPSWAASGDTYARFRLSTSGDLAPNGPAADGEMEDYLVSLTPPGALSPVFAQRHVVNDKFYPEGMRSPLAAADVDGNGHMDVVSASFVSGEIAWHENDGNGHFGKHTISQSIVSANAIVAADVNGDGHVDVLSVAALDDRIAWYENRGSGIFDEHVISTSADGAISVFAADIDGDGYMDVLSASDEDNKIAWYENDGSSQFTEHAISTSAARARSVYAADVDGDGDMDVLSASHDDYKIVWYENDGTEFFTEHTISTSARGAMAVSASDVNGDGHMDVLSASYLDDKIAWYENDGSEQFTERLISTSVERVLTVYAADVNGDGYVDVVPGTDSGRSPSWYENNGSGSFIEHPFGESPIVAPLILATDVNGDGRLDLLACDPMTQQIFWYENSLPSDFGDAPNKYGTTLRTDGARHLATGPRLGASRDVETDGLPMLGASGDDGDGSDDEDGVVFASTTTVGQPDAIVTVNVQDAPAGAKLDAWVDFNGNGTFHVSDRIATAVPLHEGDNQVTFAVPASAILGTTYARFRLSSAGNLGPTGSTLDGEVEDHEISFVMPTTDFGDAPDTYGTTVAADGAYHQATGPTLGDTRDVEGNGLPTLGANGDDTTANPDEDGVTFDRTLVAGQYYTPITIHTENAPSGAKLDAWIDFDGNGSFDPHEQIADSVHVRQGYDTILFDIPASAVPGQTYARFRLSTEGDLAPTGPADDGEVEDYRVTIYDVDPDISTIDLGEVDYERQSGLSYRNARYQFNSSRSGYVTIDARTANVLGVPFNVPVTLVLCDTDGNVLQTVETSNSHARIDHLDQTGGNRYTLEIYTWSHVGFPAVVGGSPKLDLRICNLVSPLGQNVDVFGTSDTDSFDFRDL